MSITRVMCALSATALLALPAYAGAARPTTNPGRGYDKTEAPATPKAKGKAYGKHCQAESKKHVAGEKGTAFSRCVNAMAKAAEGDSPTEACKGLSKKHVKGEKGTPYSRCIVAAAQLDKDVEPQPSPTPAATTGS